jgi:hypothetical protein
VIISLSTSDLFMNQLSPRPPKASKRKARRLCQERFERSTQNRPAFVAIVRLPQGALGERYTRILENLDHALCWKGNSLHSALTGSIPLQPAAGYPTQEVRAIERDAIAVRNRLAMTSDKILVQRVELVAFSYDGIGVVHALHACAQLELALESTTKQCEVSRDVELSRWVQTLRKDLEQRYRRLEQLGNALCKARANLH